MSLKSISLALTLPLLAACGTVDYASTRAGTFTGSLFVMWVGEGGPSGDGKFVYVPAPDNPLTLHRKTAGTLTDITPGMMYTDGGSIPRIGQLFKGFSPWGYAPAYMVHDWLFVARHCITDDDATPAEQKTAAMSFQESADIIAEAIKTLVAEGKVLPNDVAAQTISGVVAGPFSYRRWTVKGACADDRVSAADRAAVKAAIPGAAKSRLQGMERVLPGGTTTPVKPATIVGIFSF